MMKLSDEKMRALIGIAFSTQDQYSFANFNAIGVCGKLDGYLVRRCVRFLARRGLAEYAKGLTNDSGEFKGAGYRLTEAGWIIIKQKKEVMSP
jgi:hypothetical protein